MKLNRRFKRNIKHSLSFYISATLLTAISVFMLVTMYTCVLMIDTGFKAAMEKGNVEEAQFTTFTTINDDGIKEIENKYNTELEQIHCVDIEEDGYTLRVFAPTEKINRYEILEGKDIEADNEILLNRSFALEKDILVGDNYVVGGKEYKVVGFAVRPDYLYAQKDTTDFYLDKSMFGQVTMSKVAFSKLENTQSYYVIVYHQDNNDQVRQFIYKNYFTLSYMSSDSNNRIVMVKDVVKQMGIMVGMIIPVMFAMITIIVTVVLGRKVKKEQKQIGTLTALGYRKKEIIKHYAIYAAIPGIIGSAIGIILGVIFLKPVCIYFATDYEQINYDIKLYWTALIIAAVVPTVLYMIATVFTVIRMLRNNTVILLAGSADGDTKGRGHFLAKSKMSFHRKFQLRTLLKHKSRTFVVIMGMFVGGFSCALGLIVLDSCKYLIDDGLDAAGSYEYQYYLNTIDTEELKAGEPMLSVNFEVEGQPSLFTLSGLVKEPKYLNLNTKSGNEIEYGKYYMTSNAAALYGIKAGDEFTFINILTTKTYTVTVQDIIDDNTQCVLYTSKFNVAQLLGAPEDSYNVVLSDKQLSLDKDKIYMENSKQNLKAQLENTMQLIMSFIYLMLVFGAILCIISVYLIVNMLIEENAVNISMLKVLGYRKKEINSLILNTNHILLPISFILSIWMCIELCKKLFEAFIAQINVYIEPTITITSMLICLSILVLSYFVSLSMLKRKIYRVDMVESLKDNRD